MMQDQTLHNINQNFIDMKTNPYVSPEIESIDMSIEAVLCASGSDSIDFTSVGGETLEDSGYTINWGE